MNNKSQLFDINLRDFTHGLIIAAGTGAFTVIEQALSKGSMKVDWRAVGLAALAGGITYIGKKFFSGAKPTEEVK